MKIQDFIRRFRFAIILITCISIGAFLRLYLIADQVLLDDEWHGLFYATGHSLDYLLLYADGAATCAPLNAYAWILLHTTGWSEMALRLPSLVPGLLALLIFPLLVRRIHGEAVASIFAVFLSLSPFLTAYSRIFRPYSALVFFEFIAIYSAGIWLHTGEKRFWLLYILTAMAAIYFHPVAVIGVFAPLIVAGVLHVWKRKFVPTDRIPDFHPGWSRMIPTAAFVAVFFALNMQATVIAENISPGQAPSFETWKQFLLMLFGTTNVIFAYGFTLCCLIGAWILFKKNFFWGAVFTLVVLLHLLMLFICKFIDINMPIVLTRYLIILIPLAHIITATGLQRFASRIGDFAAVRQSMIRGMAIALVVITTALWVFTNPLLYAYVAPNNFTNHSAFIESGQFGGWAHRYKSWHMPQLALCSPPRMSLFYKKLTPQTRRLIEYPMMLGDHFNYYYFYQHHHGKQLTIGYMNIVDDMPPNREGVDAELLVNHVMRAVNDDRRIRFRNMVDILDIEAVRHTQADYLICHKNLFAEFLPGFPVPTRIPTSGVKECIHHSEKYFGPSVFEDENIVVFHVADKHPRDH